VRRLTESPTERYLSNSALAETRVRQIAPATLQSSLPNPISYSASCAGTQTMQMPHRQIRRRRYGCRIQNGIRQVLLDEVFNP